jgi:hypothetical protein
MATIRRAGYTESVFIEYSDVPVERVTRNPFALSAAHLRRHSDRIH